MTTGSAPAKPGDRDVGWHLIGGTPELWAWWDGQAWERPRYRVGGHWEEVRDELGDAGPPVEAPARVDTSDRDGVVRVLRLGWLVTGAAAVVAWVVVLVAGVANLSCGDPVGIDCARTADATLSWVWVAAAASSAVAAVVAASWWVARRLRA